MCGIAGILDNTFSNPDGLRNAVSAMAARLTHRGHLLAPSMGIFGAAFSVLILATAGLVGFAIQLGFMVAADKRVASPLLAISR